MSLRCRCLGFFSCLDQTLELWMPSTSHVSSRDKVSSRVIRTLKALFFPWVYFLIRLRTSHQPVIRGTSSFLGFSACWGRCHIWVNREKRLSRTRTRNNVGQHGEKYVYLCQNLWSFFTQPLKDELIIQSYNGRRWNSLSPAASKGL